MSYGILVDYEYCTNCHTCEVACKMERALPYGQFGVKVMEVGPWAVDEENDEWVLEYVPTFTDQCDMCADRVGKGKLPACVHNCYTGSMKFGTMEELAKEMDRKPHQVLFRPAKATDDLEVKPLVEYWK